MRRLLLCLALAAPQAALAEVQSFQTPSGNVQCTIDMAAAPLDLTCTLIENHGNWARMKPINCTRSWAHVFKLRETGPARMRCSDPPQRVSVDQTIRPGEVAVFGQINCLLQDGGLLCSNADGPGFLVSRSAQEVFF